MHRRRTNILKKRLAHHHGSFGRVLVVARATAGGFETTAAVKRDRHRVGLTHFEVNALCTGRATSLERCRQKRGSNSLPAAFRLHGQVEYLGFIGRGAHDQKTVYAFPSACHPRWIFACGSAYISLGGPLRGLGGARLKRQNRRNVGGSDPSRYNSRSPRIHFALPKTSASLQRT